MGHPAVENATPFAFEPVFVADEEGRPLLVPLVKATYDIAATGLTLAEEQQPPLFEGEPNGDPEVASWRYEPEGTLPKPATDVVLVGSAVAPRAGTTELMVALQVGPLRKGVRVLGDRVFFRSVGGVGMSRPAAFEEIPLQWERAFGGWDRSHPDERKHTFEPRNPVGVGYRASSDGYEDGLPCPNLEDPARPFRGWGDRPPPAGFGFTSPNWEPRVQYAGTYDERWQKERAPLLPRDFDRRFLSAASPGLVAAGYLRGDEPVVVSGVAAEGGYAFRLPGVEAPRVGVQVLGAKDALVQTRLDTLVVDTDERKVFLFWRGELALRDPTGVTGFQVGVGAAGAGSRPAAQAM
ncbi:MAG TPA: DUF2169 domain-containing protein [Anaeromyxobacter sp.]|nr:DUF2169 domain-containing protein [Anaeromyxobacter sp.]